MSKQMESESASLFPEYQKEPGSIQAAEHTTGILPSQRIEELIKAGHISAQVPISGDQIQPASMDLRLGPVAYRVRASFLPGDRKSVV